MQYCIVIGESGSRVQREDWSRHAWNAQKHVKNGHINGSEVCNSFIAKHRIMDLLTKDNHSKIAYVIL